MTEKKSINILESLISFDTTSFKSNLNLINYIQTYLKKYNIDSSLIYDSSKKKANLFATIGPDKDGGIMLSGHTDVVPTKEQNWSSDPYVLTKKKDKLYGRGTSDMKGFIALVLSRVPFMVSANLSEPIHLAFSYDEELGCIGAYRLIDFIENHSIKPSACIVGEPTNMEVVIGHKGKCSHEVEINGLACHSGQAPLGVNAINYAAKLINKIDEIANEKSIQGPFDYDYEIPYTTLHTGVIKGGSVLNIVPDKCLLEFEIRHLLEDDPNELIKEIKKYASENLEPSMKKISDLSKIIFKKKISYPSLLIDQNNKLVLSIKKILKNNKHKKVIFGTEGGLFQEKLNIPSIVCGPGSIDQAHKADEFIEINQLEMGGLFLDGLLSSIKSNTN